MIEKQACVVQPAHQRTQQEVEQVRDVTGVTYLSEGQGRPILFLHGIAGAARQFAPQVRHFAAGRHAIAWDMPGHGGSAPLPLVTVDALAAELGSFIAALGLDRPVLVGHGLGGMVAQRLLAEAPHAASALVLAQTTAAFCGNDPAAAAAFVRSRLGPLDEGNSMADLAAGLVAALAGAAPDPDGLALARECVAATPDSSYRDTVLGMRGFDLRAALPRLLVPTLLVAGTRDREAPAAVMREMADQVPNARLVEIEGAGHLAHLEQPARFNAAVAAFLDEAGL
jgi:3-oxoadipate enol-lactonase